MKPRTLLPFAAAALLAVTLGYLVLLSLSSNKCCDELDKEYVVFDALVSRAGKGDLSAMQQLYSDFRAAGRLAEARYWALVGAMAGSQELTTEYLRLHGMLSSEERLVDERVIRKNASRPGALRLAELLNIPLE